MGLQCFHLCTKGPKTLLDLIQNSDLSCYCIKIYVFNDKSLDRCSDFSDTNKMNLKCTLESSEGDWRKL